MGCGKSSVGRALAKSLGFPFVDLDDYVVRMTGRSIAAIFRGGEASFRDIETRALREVLAKIGKRDYVVALGGGTLMKQEAQELVFGKTVTVYLRATLGTILERTKAEIDSRPLLKGGSVGELLSRRAPVYEMADYIVNTDGRTIPEIVSEIRELIQPGAC